MRTVSFSQPEVQELLNQQFVNTYVNTTGDPSSGESIWHSPTDPPGSCIRGNGAQNVQSIFMTPDGKIFHVASGYLDATDLENEIRFAAQVFEKLKKNPQGQVATIVQAHVDRLNENGMRPFDPNRNEVQRMMQSFSSETGLTNNGEAGPTGLFDAMIRSQFQRDQQFSIDHPSQEWSRFAEDPRPLLGNGKSFFSSSSSSSNGNPSGIGSAPGLDSFLNPTRIK